MRNTAKTSTLEDKFPLLAVENNCILSKDADITAFFEVRLPELFTVASAEYEAYTRLGIRRLKPYPILRSFISKIGTSRKATLPIWQRQNKAF